MIAYMIRFGGVHMNDIFKLPKDVIDIPNETTEPKHVARSKTR